MCKIFPKSTNHICRSFPNARIILNTTTSIVGIINLFILVRKSKKSQQGEELQNLFDFCIFWYHWKIKNAKRFTTAPLDPFITWILAFFKAISLYKNNKWSIVEHPYVSIEHYNWTPPPHGWTKVNINRAASI